MNSDEIENVWSGLISSEPYPTALAALQAHNKPGYNTVIVRIGRDAAVPSLLYGLCSRIPTSPGHQSWERNAPTWCICEGEMQM